MIDAEHFVRNLMEHHADLLASGDIEVRDAIIIKSIALLVLAFDISAVDGEPPDQKEALEKLAYALEVIARRALEEKT
jgi:hypothetical protein